MKVQVVVHEAEEGGFWAEVPALGCVTEGDTREELLTNLRDAVEGVFCSAPRAWSARPRTAAWSKRRTCEGALPPGAV